MKRFPIPVLKKFAAGALAAAALSALSTPAMAQDRGAMGLVPAKNATGMTNPVRWNTGGAVWSTDLQEVADYLDTGEVTDRGLAGGIARSGWTSEEVRTGMTKTYSVDLVGVSRFLYSDAGVKFLKNASNSYFPYYSMNTYAVQALRSAIIADAADGSISSFGIMSALPTDFRLADFCNTYTGAQNICAEGRCQEGTAQCTSLLSWYVFLPACIQANQQADPVAEVKVVEPAPAVEPIRGLW